MMMIPSYQISLAHRESRTEYIKTLHISPSAGNRGLGGTRNYHKYQIGNVIWNIFQVTPLEGKYICQFVWLGGNKVQAERD